MWCLSSSVAFVVVADYGDDDDDDGWIFHMRTHSTCTLSFSMKQQQQQQLLSLFHFQDFH